MRKREFLRFYLVKRGEDLYNVIFQKAGYFTSL